MMIDVPYQQIKTNSEKAVFYLGFLWELLVDVGIIDPRKIYLLDDKENVVYEDYADIFVKMKNALEKRQNKVFEEITQYIEKNLSKNNKYNIKDLTFFVLGNLCASHLKGSIMTASEANKKWGLPDGEVRQSLNRGKLKKYIGTGLVRQSEKVWLVTELAMKEVYGEPNTSDK